MPYVRPERPFGRTTNSFLGNLGWARRAIVSFSYAPLNLIAWMAVCTVVLALSGAAVQILLRLVAPDLVPAGLTTVIVVILVMSSFQLICLAVLGSYMAHIYEEVKRRPPFIVSRTINAPGERAGRRAGSARRDALARRGSGAGIATTTLQLRPTRCAVCGTEGHASDVHPARLPDALASDLFAARRVPDGLHCRIVRCLTCGLLRSDPALDPGQMAELYGASDLPYGDEIANLRATYRRYLARARDRAAGSESLLEIGCASGFVLEEALAMGWSEVRGIEPSAGALAHAPGWLRPMIVQDVVRPGLFPPESFDTVCMFQVMDHLPDPAGVIAECADAPAARRDAPDAAPRRRRPVGARPRPAEPDRRPPAHLPL